jgi:hypothetical protein
MRGYSALLAFQTAWQDHSAYIVPALRDHQAPQPLITWSLKIQAYVVDAQDADVKFLSSDCAIVDERILVFKVCDAAHVT